jgi:hypothetical protein
MLPFLLPPRVFRSLVFRSTAFAPGQLPSASSSCSRSFVTSTEDHPEDLEAAEGELDESNPWSHFQPGDFESIGGGGGRKGGRSRLVPMPAVQTPGSPAKACNSSVL